LHVTGSRWWQGLDTIVAAALPAGARVLDVGCGDGGLVDRLTELGFDALGVDPAAPARPRLVREAVEHVRDLGAFDAVTVVRRSTTRNWTPSPQRSAPCSGRTGSCSSTTSTGRPTTTAPPPGSPGTTHQMRTTP
jgi:hypothetical protein